MQRDLNALRLPDFFDNLGHSNVISTSGVVHMVTSTLLLRVQFYCVRHDCWKSGSDPIEYAKEHNEFARALESF
ncbi:MAG: RuBisCO large subunit C-terminal-like domain-containing protein, partial [Chromatiales bacterium]|nr:RuBisCO large subunit C-terminal-like domain-containing protein [Chromatiales bacterium]